MDLQGCKLILLNSKVLEAIKLNQMKILNPNDVTLTKEQTRFKLIAAPTNKNQLQPGILIETPLPVTMTKNFLILGHFQQIQMKNWVVKSWQSAR